MLSSVSIFPSALLPLCVPLFSSLAIMMQREMEMSPKFQVYFIPT